jgi:hypothetical protein
MKITEALIEHRSLTVSRLMVTEPFRVDYRLLVPKPVFVLPNGVPGNSVPFNLMEITTAEYLIQAFCAAVEHETFTTRQRL